LRNVSISPASNLTQETFEQSFPALSSMKITLDMIMHRFDKLPLHKFCYDYHSSHEDQELEGFKHQVARLPAHGINQDCLGMTPLHILACRGHSVEIFQCMIEKFPHALLIQDRWGDLPCNYALYAEASIKVIHFLFATHRLRWGTLPFDFSHAIETLAANFNFPPQYVRDVIRAQRVYFPSLAIDWQRLVNIFIVNWEDITIDMYRVLVEASVSTRHICISEEHKSIIDARVLAMNDEINRRDADEDDENEGTIIQYYYEIRDLITNYAHLHHEYLLEATTILELALWKTAVILRSSDDKQELTRVDCRIDAGCCAEVVIKLVLAFL